MGHYFEWVGVGGALFLVGVGERENILGGWGWVHCLIMPNVSVVVAVQEKMFC